MNAYQQAADVLIRESGVTWTPTKNNAHRGAAWCGSPDWKIEAPTPTTPLRFGIFAHEVAHQLLHRHGSSQRWQQEIEAWEYALAQFDRFNLPGKDDAHARATRSIRYAIRKALRRSNRPLALARTIRSAFPHWLGIGYPQV